MTDLKSQLRLMKWMLGLTIAVNLASFGLLVRLAFGGPGG